MVNIKELYLGLVNTCYFCPQILCWTLWAEKSINCSPIFATTAISQFCLISLLSIHVAQQPQHKTCQLLLPLGLLIDSRGSTEYLLFNICLSCYLFLNTYVPMQSKLSTLLLPLDVLIDSRGSTEYLLFNISQYS